MGGHFLYGFDHIPPPNNDEKKRIDPDFWRLPPPFIPHCWGYNTISEMGRISRKPCIYSGFREFWGNFCIKSVRAACFKDISCYYKEDSPIVICSFGCCQSLICCFEIEILVCTFFLSFYAFKLFDCFIKEIIDSICNQRSSFFPLYNNRFHNH